MINHLNEYTIGVVYGVRYRANFAIEDQLGKIVDQILYSRDSFFGPEMFPLVQNGVNEKVLINEETQDKLIINNSTVVLEVNLTEDFTTEDIPEISKRFNEQIIGGVLRDFRVTEINRIGLVCRYLFQMEELADSFINKTIGATLEGINDINLRFSKKLPLPEALALRDINDYLNVIFNIIKRADRKELFVSIDFQHYFDPFLESSSQIHFMEFIDTANAFNTQRFLDWLNTNYGVLK